MGEDFDEVIFALKDVSQIDIDIVMLGQYLHQRPNIDNSQYITQDEFNNTN